MSSFGSIFGRKSDDDPSGARPFGGRVLIKGAPDKSRGNRHHRADRREADGLDVDHSGLVSGAGTDRSRNGSRRWSGTGP